MLSTIATALLPALIALFQIIVFNTHTPGLEDAFGWGEYDLITTTLIDLI